MKYVNKGKAFSLVSLFFIFLLTPTFSQTPFTIDSLENAYRTNSYTLAEELELLKTLSEEHTDLDKKLSYSNLLINKTDAADSPRFHIAGYIQKGTAYRLKSDLSEAMDTYFQGAEIALKTGRNKDLGIIKIAIADVYSIMGNHHNSVKYYNQAISLLKSENDSTNIASALLNAGDEYFNAGTLDTALIYTEESAEIFEQLKYSLGQAYALGNAGMIYAEMGLDQRAERSMSTAITIMEAESEFYPIAVYLTFIADIYAEKGDNKAALNYAQQSLDIAQKYGLKEQIGDAYLKLSELNESMGNQGNALSFFKDHVIYEDSVRNLSAFEEAAISEDDQRQVELALIDAERRNEHIITIAAGIASILILLLAIGLYRRTLFMKRTSLLIENERNISDSLLLNILPAGTTKELKESGKVQAKNFSGVTVLFSDFKGFTTHAERLAPEVLVETLDLYFSKFDKLMEKHGIEKIKTVGDMYMCAAGVPEYYPDHAKRMMDVAYEMLEFVAEQKTNAKPGETRFDIRIGINSGPVVAGIVGTKKFSYDIWGDTVNIASRLETMSEIGKINISEATYQLVKKDFDFNYRGELDVKNKGTMKMYFAKNQKPKADHSVTSQQQKEVV